MKINSIKEVNILLENVEKCEGEVYLNSVYGDHFNLKSKLSVYVAIGALLSDHGEELELFCANKNDERHFLSMFQEHPEMR